MLRQGVEHRRGRAEVVAAMASQQGHPGIGGVADCMNNYMVV